MNLTDRDYNRFIAKIDKQGPVPDQNKEHYAGLGACWVWTAFKDKDGYGCFRLGKTHIRAHRVSWFLRHETSPPCVCHQCDNPSCVNPNHLFEGTFDLNNKDRKNKGRNKPDRGEKHHTSKLTEFQVLEIRQLRAQGETGRSLAQRYGVSPSVISEIHNRIAWSHI